MKPKGYTWEQMVVFQHLGMGFSSGFFPMISHCRWRKSGSEGSHSLCLAKKPLWQSMYVFHLPVTSSVHIGFTS